MKTFLLWNIKDESVVTVNKPTWSWFVMLLVVLTLLHPQWTSWGRHLWLDRHLLTWQYETTIDTRKDHNVLFSSIIYWSSQMFSRIYQLYSSCLNICCKSLFSINCPDQERERERERVSNKEYLLLLLLLLLLSWTTLRITRWTIKNMQTRRVSHHVWHADNIRILFSWYSTCLRLARCHVEWVNHLTITYIMSCQYVHVIEMDIFMLICNQRFFVMYRWIRKINSSCFYWIDRRDN
jgi:hypothetical protein